MALRAFLDRPADLDPVAHRQVGADGVQLLVDGTGDVDAFRAAHHIRLHGDGGLAVAFPDHAVFQVVMHLAQATQRHGAIGRGHGQRGQAGGVDPFFARRAQADVDELVAFAVLRHGIARQRHRQKVRDVVGADAQFARLLLVNLETHGTFRGFVPVELYVDRAAVGADLRSHFFRHRAHFRNLVATDAELHGVAHGRSVFQPGQAGADGGELLAQHRLQPTGELFAVFHGMRGNDQLAEVRRGQLLVQRQVEARRAGTHEADRMVYLGAAFQRFLQTLDLAQRGRE
ncbi:hypothetical protein D3C72_1506260 [compost metagenome]